MKWIASLVSMSAVMLASAGISQAGNCVPCGGCSDPCARATVAPGCISEGIAIEAGCLGAGAPGALNGATLNADLGPVAKQLCQPIQGYKVVMESKYVTESRPVVVWKTRNETRYRTKTVYKTVPVTETKYRTKTVQVPITETKTLKYTQLVPVKTEKSIELSESVPVWNEVAEEYTVRVPQLVDVPEKYTVKVPLLQEETFTYTVNVPHVVTEQRVHTVMNAVPVSKTRTIQVCVPQTTMQAVTKDYGHWEEQLVPGSAVAAGARPAVRTVRRGSSSGRGGLLSRLFGNSQGRSCASSCAPAASCSACGTSCGGGCGAGAGGCGSA
ncbi:MAG: ferredoxin, partial [Aeoliella sp.]